LLANAPVCAETLATGGVADLDLAVETARSESTTPFIAVAVTTAANVCHARQYADAAQVSDDAPARFHAASISKLLTATVILQLQSEGKLFLKDSVGKYEPLFAGSPIKLVDLLTHTSGLRDRIRANARREQRQVDAYVAALAKQKLANRPGERWENSDAGFNLLGRVVERITEHTFADAMRERLLEPLGMHDSDFDIERIPLDRRLAAFDKKGTQRPHPWDLAFLPSSGLQTTAEDLAKFAGAILRTAARSEGWTPFDADALGQMTRVHIATEWDGIGQGLGWQIASSELGPQWRHAGGERGFEGLLTLYPDKGFAIVVLGNKSDWPRFELERTLRTLASDDLPLSCGAEARAENPGASSNAGGDERYTG
jgi:CubicO group peptidase (beta-lactamase class C family)